VSDPLDALRTHEGATPGPWTVCYMANRERWGVYAGAGRVVAVCLHEADARAIATHADPGTTREVVELLAEMRVRWAGEPDANASWRCLVTLDALLARIRERMGEP